jgi:hypothetical protein
VDVVYLHDDGDEFGDDKAVSVTNEHRALLASFESVLRDVDHRQALSAGEQARSHSLVMRRAYEMSAPAAVHAWCTRRYWRRGGGKAAGAPGEPGAGGACLVHGRRGGHGGEGHGPSTRLTEMWPERWRQRPLETAGMMLWLRGTHAAGRRTRSLSFAAGRPSPLAQLSLTAPCRQRTLTS